MPPHDFRARYRPVSRAEVPYSRSSTSSSASGYGDETFSRSNSISSSSSLSSTLPWNAQNNPTLLIPPNHAYDLPCEFGFTGCRVLYHYPDVEAWIAHSVTHFQGQPPPPKSVCIFCDTEAGSFETDGNDRARMWLWNERMMHINKHLRNLAPTEVMKPDFFLIDYMKQVGLISLHEYNCAIAYSERPKCDGLLPLGTKLSNTAKREIIRVEHDLQKEKRQMRKEKDKKNEKNKDRNAPSHITRHTYQD